MDDLSSRERLIRTLKGEPIDRIATFDILHNIDLCERVADAKLGPHNAEDLMCRAGSQLLDLMRHFAVPRSLEPELWTDETGFVYQYEWWTAHLVERPIDTSSADEVADAMERDIDLIYRHIESEKVCRLARQHVMLFDETYEYMAEVKADFKRTMDKLDGTVLLAPEDVSATAIATERYDETGWWYAYHDHPETAVRYLEALTDYQLCFIDSFADANVACFAQISIAVGTDQALLYAPDFFRQEVIPREQKKIDRWKEHGYYVLAFLDGYKWPLIEDFLDLGVDEIHPCEPYCQMEVRRLREEHPELVISQPIDCRQLLPLGTEEEVREAVRQAIEDAGRRKIMIGSTSEIHPGVPPGNALAMYEAARSYPL